MTLATWHDHKQLTVRQECGHKKDPQGFLKDETWGNRVETNSHIKSLPQSSMQQIYSKLLTKAQNAALGMNGKFVYQLYRE